jgi:hypothetical protein
MIKVLANAMATTNEFQNFFTSWIGLIALAFGECAYPVLKNKYEEKKVARSSPILKYGDFSLTKR